VLLLALVSVAGYGGTDDNGRYAVEKIPPSLRKGADAVVRLRHLRFEVKDSRYAVQIVTEAVTIFDRDRSDLGRWVQTYDNHIDIEDIQGTLYDAQGNEVRRLDDDDISDYSAISGFSIYEDTRVKRAKLMAAQVPYTVEYRYEISYDGFINWPFWVAQENDYPVERTRFEVLLPSSKRLRYWCNVDTLPPTITTTGGSTLYSWEATNLPQLTSNWATENAYDVTIVVRIAPHEFEIEGTRGDMSTWKSFGQWCYGLYRNRDRLPPGAHQEVLQRIASCLTDRDKVFALYDHFQSKTRYVSVQLGLG
ncbi:MAG: DUF3857 domain-containing protein, partial [Proteobacteria bacterium]|nr:DUF3857 domain-containing protein [Pseudomonadota bacterium]